MNQNPGTIGKKVGMTQIYAADGNVLRCTVIAAAATVVGKRTKEKDGYSALVLGLGERKEKHTNKSQLATYKKANVTPKAMLRELRCPEEQVAKFEIGATIPLDQVFTEGQFVDVQGITRGRGFTGVMRRWNFAGFPKTHGTHEYRRHGGSIGTNMTPGRTLPNLKMPGHYGTETVTVLNVKIAKIMKDEGLILIEGGVPGAKESYVVVRGAIKKKNAGNKKALAAPPLPRSDDEPRDLRSRGSRVLFTSRPVASRACPVPRPVVAGGPPGGGPVCRCSAVDLAFARSTLSRRRRAAATGAPRRRGRSGDRAARTRATPRRAPRDRSPARRSR